MTPPLAPNGGELVKRLRTRTTIGYQGRSWDDLGYPDKDCAEAADRIEALGRELAQVEAINLDMTARMDRISTGALYADLTTRATSAELTVTALRERLEGIAEIADRGRIWQTPRTTEMADRLDQIHTLGVGYFGNPDDGNNCRACRGSGAVPVTPTSDATPRGGEREAEHEAFEAWCKTEGININWARVDSRTPVWYTQEPARWAWKAWQAARLAPAVTLTSEDRIEIDGAKAWASAVASPSAAVRTGDAHIVRLLAVIDRITGAKP